MLRAWVVANRSPAPRSCGSVVMPQQVNLLYTVFLLVALTLQTECCEWKYGAMITLKRNQLAACYQ